MRSSEADLEERIHDAAVAANGGKVVTDTNRHSLLGGLRTGDWLQDQQFPELTYAVPGLIPEGLTLVIGAPKIGKSWLVDGLALAIAAGGRALGHIPILKPRPVLLLALEDGHRRLQDRCWKLLEGEPIPAAFHFMVRTEPGAIIATIEEWLTLYHDEDPVVFVDTLGKVMPPALPGESSYQRDYRVGGALKRLADDHPGSSVAVNHHDRKAGSDDFVDAVSGTHGLAGAADTLLVLNRARQETQATIKITGRDVPENEYALNLDDGMFWTLSGGDLESAASRATTLRAAAGLGDRSLDVLHFVVGHPAGVAPKDVEAALKLPDARKYLQRLTDSGRIANPSRGLYKPLSQPSQVSQPDEALGQRDTCDTPLEGLES